MDFRSLAQTDVRTLLALAKSRLGRPRARPDGHVRVREAGERETDVVVEPETGALDARIYFSDAQWRIILEDHASGEIALDRSGDAMATIADAEPGRKALDGLRSALRALAPGERADIRTIALWPQDPEIEFFDSRAVRAYDVDRPSLASVAERVLGEKDAGIDVGKWGRDGQSDSELQCVAMCRLEVSRRYIAALEDLASRLRSITPLSISRLAEGDDALAVLSLGVDTSLLICSDPETGAIVRRGVPVGIRALAGDVAAANSLPFVEALREMGARDMLARAREAGVSTAFDRLVDMVGDTLRYLSDSRLADPPSTLHVEGLYEAVQGFDGLIGEASGLRTTLVNGLPTPLASPPINLLKGFGGVYFSEGARDYRFDGERFVGSENQDTKPKRASGETRQVKKIGPLELPSFDVELTPRLVAAAVAVAGLGMAFLGHQTAIAPAKAAVSRATDAYGAEQSRVVALQQQVNKLLAAARRDGGVIVVDKILWAEKFEAIGRALPANIWLTDARIVNEERRVGKVDVLTTKLALKGMTSAPGETRLQSIAAFIAALERDQEFMRDFRRIVFAGLGDADAGQTGPVSFELHAWYDENNRKRAGEAGADPLSAARSAAANQASRAALFGGGQ